MKNDGLVLDVKAHNAYLYSTEDMTHLMVASSCAKDNSVATVVGHGKEKPESYIGTFNSYIGNKLNLNTENEFNKVASTASEITVEQNPSLVTIASGEYKWCALREQDNLGLNRTAAPYKATFKPLATRYELDNQNMTNLRDTFSKLFKQNAVYRISGTDNENPRFCYLNVETLLDIAGVSPLRSGAGVCKHKGIKIFKLANGLGLKLGDTLMVAVTEAAPKFKEKENLFVRQEDPETKRWYLEPVAIKISKGFNPYLQQFAYDVTMKNGNQLFDIPESDLLVDNVAQKEPENVNEVSFDHFK